MQKNIDSTGYEAPDFSVADLEDAIAIVAGGSYWSSDDPSDS